MGVFVCKNKSCEHMDLYRVTYVGRDCSWCGREMLFVADNVPEKSTKDGLFWRPEEEKDGEVC